MRSQKLIKHRQGLISAGTTLLKYLSAPRSHDKLQDPNFFFPIKALHEK